jgi:transposase
MAHEYWLSDEAWSRIEPLIPMDRRGVKPANNRRVISGIRHVLKHG